MTSQTDITIYGIKNCDTMKKALTWLDQHSIDYRFHDYKKEGIPEALADSWTDALPLDQLINKRGTTWRKLPDEDKAELNKASAMRLICEQPSLVKRPLLEKDGQHFLGFKAEQYETIFA